MKILFINLPYYGHFVPTVGLVRELLRRGCEVAYLMPFGWEEKVAESGAMFYGYADHWQLSEQMKNALAVAERMVADYDLIVYEQFFFLGKHLAEKYQKPAVRIFTAPVTNEKLMKEYIATKGPLSVFRYKWVARAFTKDIAGDMPLKTDNWLDEIVQNPPDLNLVYTLREYQPYAEEFPEEKYKFLGPSVYEREGADPEYMKAERPLIYISLGTVVRGNIRFYQSCIEAFREENADVVISVGAQCPIRKLKNIPPHIRVRQWVPQTQVLEAADVFVTHGGMNSVSEALVAGVPMVVIPFTSDQPVNAKCIERLGVGKILEYDSLSKDGLREKVHEVMKDAQIKKHLAHVQELIMEAPGNKGGAEMILEYMKSYNNICNE